MIPNTIQPREYSRGGGKEDLAYDSPVVDSNGNSCVVVLNGDSDNRNLNLNDVRNKWDSNYWLVAFATLFISLPFARWRIRGSFVLPVDCASRLVVVRLLRVTLIRKHIF